MAGEEDPRKHVTNNVVGANNGADQKDPKQQARDDPVAGLKERIKQLESEIQAKTKQITTLEEDLKWNRSDFENYRKSIEKRLDSEKQNILAKILKDFLPFFDAFDKGMESARLLQRLPDLPDPVLKFLGGLESLYKNLGGILDSRKLTRMETVGKPFDYNFHEVMMQIEDDTMPEDTIMHEAQEAAMHAGKV
nr:nucleotide exchange factor GrpE [Candidatus Sigynarchaeota archaeon]